MFHRDTFKTMVKRERHKMIRSIFALVALFIQSAGFAQTYEIIKVELSSEVKEMPNGINTGANEFSPFVFDNVLYFASDRSPDVLIEGENAWSKTENVNLFQAKIKGSVDKNTTFKSARLVSERLVNQRHTGPANLSVTGDTLFFSQVPFTKKEEISHPQLYYSVKLGNRWSKSKALPFNEKTAAFSHPFYDSSTERLYFSSNKKGGKGASDIYYSQLSDNGWESPVAVPAINTAKDEMYPYICKNILLYASEPKDDDNLDVFWMDLGLQTAPVKLEGMNSNQDDFGLYIFPGMTKGFLSSNRGGDDDVYFFNIERVVTVRNEMAGEFKYKTLDGEASGLTVQILGEDDFVLYETKTDKDGKFKFENIEYDKSYSIKALTEEDLELFLKNQDGQSVLEMLGDENNVFAYKKIGADKSGTLSLIPDDMIDFNLNQGHLSGQIIYENQPNKYPNNLSVVLIDENGDEQLTTFTDDKGNFDFKQLSMSSNYLLKVPESEDDMVLLIYDLKGNVVAQLKTNEDGEFIYRKLNPDYGNKLEQIEEDDLSFELKSKTVWGYFEYDNNKKLNKKGLVVKAFNENGDLITQQLTDEDGTFRFNNLPVERSLLFSLEENGENFILDDFTLYIYDRTGKKIAVLKRGEEGYFTFRPLGYEKNNELSQIEEDNLSFILGGDLARKLILVYFDSNESKVKSSDLKIVNNLATVLKDNAKIRVEINAYADAKSSDEYNLVLSQKRGEWIVAYLKNKGISPKRFIVNAYGESQLVDENNDALNRRAEIHLY